MKRITVLFVCAVLNASVSMAFAADAVLTWDYPYAGAAGFALYCGDRSRIYTTRIDVGNTDIYRFALPAPSVEFCAVAAYDDAGVESGLSNEVGILAREPQELAEPVPPFSIQNGGWVLPTATGVQVGFSVPIDAGKLNLYEADSATGSGADVVMVGATTGPVRGSLIVSDDRQAFTFIKSGGPLAPDTYTLTIASGPDRVVDVYGRRLDGDAHTGQDYQVAFAIPSSDLPVLSIDDFARGPGQAVNVPATDLSAGIPVSLTKGAGVTDLSFGLRYNPARLSIQTVAVDPAIIGTLTQAAIDPVIGLVRIQLTGISGLTDAKRILLRLYARVPEAAPYLSQEVLDLFDIAVNGGAYSAVDDDGLHVVAKPGDASGEGRHSSFDSYLIQRVILGLATGFGSFACVDPVAVGDVNGNNRLDSNDAYLIQLKALRYPVPQIPD